MAELSLVGIEHGARQASEVQGQGLPGHSVSQQASQSVCLCLSVCHWSSSQPVRQSVSYRAVSQSVSQSVSQPASHGRSDSPSGRGEGSTRTTPSRLSGSRTGLEGQYTLLESRINCSVLG